MSERTWAIAPMRNETAQMRCFDSAMMIPATTNAKNRLWVNPTPGKPRWSCTGSSTSLALPEKSSP